MNIITDGVWPTMVTPFTEDLKIDYKAVEALTKWYIENGANGIFAVCQSSEMFYLSLEERIKLASTVAKAAKQIPVIASGHISDDIKDQIIEINAMSETGVEAVVLVTNRLAKENENDEVWKKNLEYLLSAIPEDITLGFYECPYPYKRMLTPELLRWCAETGRFAFYKDTSCDAGIIQERLKAVEGTEFKIFNANSATLFDTLKMGASGFSGVMANFHPNLYSWLIKNWRENTQEAELLASYLAISSCIESRNYPKCAKYALQKKGLPLNTVCRKESTELTESTKVEVNHLMNLDLYVKGKLGI